MRRVDHELDGRAALSIDTHDQTLSILHYYFKAEDTSGNWERTAEKFIQLSDVDPPSLISDDSPVITYTGDYYRFSFDIQDNIKVVNVDLEYWFGEGEHKRTTMSSDGERYRVTILIPASSVDSLYYLVSSTDSSDNYIQFNSVIVPVFDDILPTILEIDDLTMYQGQIIDLKIDTSDNIGVHDIIWTGSPIPGDWIK